MQPLAVSCREFEDVRDKRCRGAGIAAFFQRDFDRRTIRQGVPVDAGDDSLYSEILDLTRRLVQQRQRPSAFRPGDDPVPYAGRVYDEQEVVAGIRSMLDFWLTLGPEGDAFQHELAAYLGVRSSVLVNSGSSANLVAVSALTSSRLGTRRLQPGDEVITAAAGFPTTVAPIIQCGCVPVFIDSDPLTANVRVDRLQDAYVPGRTKAVFLAHTLGNPFDLTAVIDFCRRQELWLIEDNCDALGSLYNGRLTGSFGDLSTQSFYPPHHLTMGEGGAVNVVREALLKLLVESFRDWGRDCWCTSGRDNTCGKRFSWHLGQLPQGYDHKYIYSHLGYNLKPLDPQAAIGRVQLQKLPEFVAARRQNWQLLRRLLVPAEEFFDFMLPTHATDWTADGFQWSAGAPEVQPSWFGFFLSVKPQAPFDRTQLARELERHRIGNRMLFGGNLVRQPAFLQLQAEYKRNRSPGDRAPFRIVGDLDGADRMMNNGLFVGVFPGLDCERIHYIAEVILRFCRECGRRRAA